jgi:hypothetical protein
VGARKFSVASLLILVFAFLVSGCGGSGPTPNSAPSIGALKPSSATAGAASQTLTVDGTNFLASSTVTYNGTAHAATFTSSTELTIQVSASDQTTAGNFPVVVTNPAPGGGQSNSVSFTVNNPAPLVSSVSPPVLAIGSPATLIKVTGSNFVATSQILLNGNSTPTTFISSIELTAMAPTSILATGPSVSVAVASAPPGGGTSSTVAVQLVSVGSLALLAVPATASAPSGPWMAFIVARDASGNPIAELPITMTASEGTLSVSQGVTDSNGSFSATITPPAGISATEAVGLVATIGGQSVSASLTFTGLSSAAIRAGNSAAAIRAELGIKATAASAASPTIAPVVIGLTTASPGSTSPFAAPNYCYTNAALSTTETAQCAALFQEQNMSLQPSNPFQAGCSVATIASTVIGATECAGTAISLISCAIAITGVGSVGTLGTTDAICAATLNLTASTLARDCAEFIIGLVTKHFSPAAATDEELVELSIEPSDDPIDDIVTECDLLNGTTNPSSTSVTAPVAGNGTQGFGNGPALAISLNAPTGVALDAKGNIYFDDDGNNVIRELTLATGEVTTIVGTGDAGYTGNGGPATAATLNHPTQVAFDSDFNLYIADAGNNVVRKVTTAGVITTVAGTGVAGFSGDGSDATQAMLNFPDSIALDAVGNLYIADTGNNRIREVTSGGVINTVVGNGIAGYGGDNGPATAAELNEPTRVVVDASGNLFISDLQNNRIREVNGSSNIITTLAGNGIAGDQGDGNSASNAELDNPVSLTLDASGNVYIADLGNQVIRVVNMQSTPATLLGVSVQPGDIATVVGGGTQSDLIPGASLSVSLMFPTGLITDKAGNLYFADADHNVILRASPGN